MAQSACYREAKLRVRFTGQLNPVGGMSLSR